MFGRALSRLRRSTVMTGGEDIGQALLRFPTVEAGERCWVWQALLGELLRMILKVWCCSSPKKMLRKRGVIGSKL